MTRRRRKPGEARAARLLYLALAGLAAGASGPAARAGDSGGLLDSHAPRLRWEEVDGPPFAVGGKLPSPRFGRRERTVSLAAGESTFVWLPANALLRLRAVRPAELPESDVEIWRSNGSGVQLRGRPVPTQDRGTLLFDPRSPNAAVVEVRRPEGRAALDLALSISRLEVDDCEPWCRDVVPLSGELVEIGEAGPLCLSGPAGYRRASGGEACAGAVRGPAHCRLESRLVYPEGEGSSLQSYALRIWVDGEPHDVRHETAVDSRRACLANGEERVLGRKRWHCFEVPEGWHEVRVESGPDVCVRLLEVSSADRLLGFGAWPPAAPGHFGRRLESEGELPFERGGLPGSLPPTPGSARYLGNSHLDAGLLTAYRAWEGLRWYGSPPRRRDEWGVTFRRNVRYRSLLPDEFRTEEPELVASFAAPALRDPLGRESEAGLRPEDVAPAIRGFSSGAFFRVPEGEANAHVFRLPRRHAPSLLRIAVARPCPLATPVFVELPGAGRYLVKILPRPELPSTAHRPSEAEAAVAAVAAELARLFGWREDRALAVARSGSPSPPIEAGTAEIELPQAVDLVRLWAEGEGVPPRVALQLLSEAPYELTEREFAEALRARAPRPAGLLEEFARWYEDPDAVLFAGDDLLAHRLPLFRFLGRELDALAAEKPNAPPPEPGPPAGAGGDPRGEAALAESFERAGEWLLALEAWTSVLRSGWAEGRLRARLGRVRALEALGEEFLAELQLLGILASESDAELRERAFEELVRFYERRDAADAIVRVLAGAVAERREPGLVRELAARLAERGEGGFALELLLDLPEEARPLDLWLRTARGAGWWRSFEEARSRLPDAAERSYWEGMRLASQRSYRAALEAFRAGGSRGARMAARIEEAVEIAKRFCGPDPRERALAVFDWEDWHARSEGPRVWASERSAVVRAAGAASCRGVARNVHELYYLSRPGRPVEARILGPRKVRLSVRPLHQAGRETRLDAWIVIRGRGLLVPVCVAGNRASQGLEIVGRPDAIPGVEVRRELPLGPGLHALEVLSEGVEMLVRFEREEPEADLGILPPLAHANLLRAFESEGGRVELPEGLDPATAARLALRIGSRGLLAERRDGLERLAAGEVRVSEEERALAAAWLEEIDRSRAPSPAGDELDRVYALAAREGPVAATERLLFAAERDPKLAPRARHLAERILRAHADAPRLAPLSRRALAGTGWERITLVRDSAGFRYVRPAGWEPELPELRVRAALLRAPRPGEVPVVGANVVRFPLRNPAPAALGIGLRLEAVEFAPLVPSTVLVRLDGEAARRVLLSPEEPEARVELAVPEGEHAVAVSVEDPDANQYVWVACGKGKGQENPEAGESESGAETGARRRYHIATAERPVRFDVEGPAWLRIDELREGRTWTRHLEVPEGIREICLRPEPGREEALFRVFRRAPAESRDLPDPPPARARIRDVPPPPWEVRARPRADGFVLADPFPPGGGEDGTFAVELSANRRRIFEEAQRGGGYDRYVELKVSYLAWDLPRSVHVEASALYREHEDAGPTAGFEAALRCRADWLPVDLKLAGSAYVQWPGGGRFHARGPAEWSLALQGSASRVCPLGPKAYHIPSLSVFGRFLSLEGASPYPGVALDPDVFSSYKDEHRNGVVLSETFVYRPWLDVEWWARAAVVSNQDFHTPVVDHVSGWLGWRQYAFGAVADVGYRIGAFWEDEDRRSTVVRHAVFARISYDFWAGPKDRIELGLEYRHDFPDDRDVGLFSIAWYFSNGRVYEDFPPGAVPFEGLRAVRVPPAYDHRVLEIYGE